MDMSIQDLIVGIIVTTTGVIYALNKLGFDRVLNKPKEHNPTSLSPLCKEVIVEHKQKIEWLTETTAKHYGKIETLEEISRQQHILIISLKDKADNDKEQFEERFLRGKSVLDEIPKMKTNIRLIAQKVGVPKEELE